jgi:hypothetical protein
MIVNNANAEGVAIDASPAEEMAAFDKLPIEIRVALANAAGCYSAPGVYEYWRQNGRATAHVVWLIACWDAQAVARPKPEAPWTRTSGGIAIGVAKPAPPVS